MRPANIVLMAASLTLAIVLLGGSLVDSADERTTTMTETRETGAKVGDAGAPLEVATLAGGCFWCLEAAFEQLRGVTEVASGYAGGTVTDPSYKQVCSGETGHAEVVQISYDAREISFKELLAVFFTIHDPTTLNRQGGDVGTQYRSAIFYHNEQQQQAATGFVAELGEAEIWSDPIVTEIVPLTKFYAAEEYHQEYYQRNSNQPYCQTVINPKLAKLRAKYADKLK